MLSRKCTTIPRSFSWVLPAQSLVTGVAIYSTVFVFKVGSKPFILAVAAAGLQFILGLYCCFTANRPGIHHRVVIPTFLVGIGGVWCGPVYYFAKIADVYLKIQQASPAGSDTPPAATWSYVGLATSCLDVIIALALVTIFLVEGLRPPKPPLIHHTPGGYVSTPVYGPPVGQPVTYQYQQQQQQQPPYQYQQQHSQPVMTSAQPFPPQYTNPTALDNKYTPTTSTTPISPIASPVSAPTTSPSPIQAPISQPPYQPYDRTNRIDVIRRICTLQNSNGSWSYSPELADLVRQWSGGGGREIRPGDDRALTLAVHACLKDLCGYVWAAQRDRAEETRLAPGEMASFRAVNWDLGFARGAIDRALRWARPF